MADPYTYPTGPPSGGTVAPTPYTQQFGTPTPGLYNPSYVQTHVYPAPYTYSDQQNVGNPAPTAGAGQQNVGNVPPQGMVNVSLVPGMGPNVAQPGEFTAADQQAYNPPAPEMGGLEAFARTLAEQLLPGEGQHDNVVNFFGLFAGLVGTGLSFAGNAAPVLPLPQFLGGSLEFGGTQQLFNQLPTTQNKGLASTAIANDPANAIYYMNQYLKMNEVELAHGLGVSPLVSDFFVPSQNLGDQVLKILSIAGLPSRAVERQASGSYVRHIDEQFFNPTPEALAAMNPAMVDVRNQFVEGKITRDEALDILSRTGFGFSNNVWDNLFWELVTDPLNVLMVAGIAAKAPAAASFAVRASKVVELARFGDVARGIPALDRAAELAMDAHATQIAMDARPGIVGRIINGLTPQVNTAKAAVEYLARDTDRLDWLEKNGYTQYSQNIISRMTPREQAIVRLEPFMRGVTAFSQNINDIFWAPKTIAGGLMRGQRAARGIYQNGERIAAFSSGATAWGFAAAYGEERVMGLQNLAQEIGGLDGLQRDMGRAVANVEAEVHGEVIARKAVAQGAVPAYMPDQIVRAFSEVYHSRLAQQVEGYVRRIKRQILPTGDDPAAKMAQERLLAKERLQNILGPQADSAKISSFIDKADEDTLALIDHLNYGHEIGNFAQARRLGVAEKIAGIERKVVQPLEQKAQAAAAKGKALNKKDAASLAKSKRDVDSVKAWAQRLTMIGPKLLTRQRANRVLAAAKAGDIVAVRDAIERYTQLFMNFSSRGLTNEQTLKDMIDFLGDLLNQKGDTLASEIDIKSLPSDLQKWAKDQADIAARMGSNAEEGYVVGLAPEEAYRWRVTKNSEGVISGVNPWIDLVDEISPTPKFSPLDVARQKIFNPVRGERILEEARRKFRAVAVRDYGMSRAESNALFSAIRALADESQTMPRGLSASILSGLADRMGMRPEVRAALGLRGTAKLVATAFEGDLTTVGLTQKITGKAKTIGANRFGNNWLGVVAEHLYPLARFTYNPVFLAQEAMEPFFWNLLKGVKPGWHWRQEDVRGLESLRLSGFSGEFSDQWEFSGAGLPAFGLQQAHIIGGPTTNVGRIWGRFLGKGQAVQTLAELKKLNYIRSMNRDMGRSMRDILLTHSPATWDTLVRETGTSDATRIANYYFLSKGLFDPDNPLTQVFLMDMSKPSWIAHSAPVHLEPLAKLHHFNNYAEMKAAIKAGTYDETKFMAHMDFVKADRDYATRAWETASGLVAQDHAVAYEDALVKGGMLRGEAKEAVAAARGITKAMAKAFGMSEDEAMARTFRDLPKFVDSTGALPAGSHYQMLNEAMSFFGREIPTQQVEAVQRVARRAQQLAGVPSAEQVDVLRGGLTLPSGMHADYRGWHRAPEADAGSQMHDLTTMVNEDIYDPKTQLRYYGTGFPAADRESFAAINAVRNNPDAPVTIYRALPTSGDRINPGDWVTPSKIYAQTHLDMVLGGEGKIIESQVPASSLIWEGNSVNEFGYQRKIDARSIPDQMAVPQTPKSGEPVIVHSAGQMESDRFGAFDTPDSLKEQVETNLGSKMAEHVVEGHDRMVGAFHELAQGMTDEQVLGLVEDHIAQPFDYYWNKRRVHDLGTERLFNAAKALDNMTGEAHIGDLKDLAAGDGDGLFVAVRDEFDAANVPLTGPPESGVKFNNAYGDGVTYGWYGKDGEFVAGATIKEYPRPLGEAVSAPSTPLEPRVIRPAETPTGAPAVEMMGEPGLPKVNQPYIAKVGTSGDSFRQGYYTKLADFVQSDGDYNWADLIGRSSQTEEGYLAGKGWLEKRGPEELRAAREEIASRMLTSYAHLMVKSDADPAKAMNVLLTLVDELGSPKRPSADLVDELVGRGSLPSTAQGQGLEPLGGLLNIPKENEFTASTVASYLLHPDVWENAVRFPDWRLDQMMRWLTGSDKNAVPPMMSLARADGFVDDTVLNDVVARHFDPTEAFPTSQTAGTMTGQEYVARQQQSAIGDREKWADTLNVEPYREHQHQPFAREWGNTPGDEMTEQDFQHLLEKDIHQFVVDDYAAHGHEDITEPFHTDQTWMRDMAEETQTMIRKAQQEIDQGAREKRYWMNQRAQARAMLLLSVRQGETELTDDVVRMLAGLAEQPALTPFGPIPGAPEELVRALEDAGMARREPISPERVAAMGDAADRIGIENLRRAAQDALSNVEDEIRRAPVAEARYAEEAARNGRQQVVRRVSPGMFRNMQQNSTEIAVAWNAEAYLGRTDWTAGKVAAVKMANYREAYKSGPRMGADNILGQGAYTIGSALVPGNYGLGTHRFPTMAEAVASGDADLIHEMVQGRPMVTRELMSDWAQEGPPLTGTSLIAVEPGLARTRIAPWDGADEMVRDAIEPGGSWVIRGTEDNVRQFAAATAAVHELDQVWALGVDDVRDLAGEQALYNLDTVQEAMNQQMGHMLVSDVIFDPGTTTEDMEKMAEHLYRRMFNEDVSAKERWVDPGASPNIVVSNEYPPEWFVPGTHEIKPEHWDEARALDNQRRGERKVWLKEMDRGVALGAIKPQDAVARGWNENWASSVSEMPQGPLYHATRYRDAVLARGLKTRNELPYSTQGLGGGTENTISVTTRKEHAERIAETLIEGHNLIHGRVNFADLFDAGRKQLSGEGRKGFADRVREQASQMWRDSTENSIGPDAVSAQQVWNRVMVKHLKVEHLGLGNEKTAAELPFGTLPAGKGVNLSDGRHVYGAYYRDMTQQEIDDVVYHAYKRYLYVLDDAGGPLDPYFVGGDPEFLRDLNPDQVGVVTVTATPGAQGYYMPGETEWRTFSGDALRVGGFWGNEPGNQPGWVMTKNANGDRVLRVMHKPQEGHDIQRWWMGMFNRDTIDQFQWPKEVLDDLASGDWGGASARVEQKVVRAHRYDVREDNINQPMRTTGNEAVVRAQEAAGQGPISSTRYTGSTEGPSLESQTLTQRVPGQEPFSAYPDIRSVHPNDWADTTRWWAENATDPWLEGKTFGSDLPGLGQAIRDYYRPSRVAKEELLYHRHTPGNWERKRQSDLIKSPGQRGLRFQKTPKGVVAANHMDAQGKSAQWFLKNADATSLVHEMFHGFTTYLDDSMVLAAHEAYSAAKGLKRMSKPAQVGGKPQLTRNVEEWFAHEFELYAATGVSSDPTTQAAFNAFGRVVRKTHGKNLKTANPEAAKVFDKLFSQGNATAAAGPFNPEEWRVMASMHYALAAAEDSAYKTHYFARGRNVMERSLNHPYLGMYPASYMWGKVVPELVKFLIAEPFGVKAPMWGYEMASTVFQAVQLQLNTDPNFREYVEKHPQLIRFISLMLPGTPWDIPVNAPAWVRDYATLQAKNEARKTKGLAPQPYDFGRELKNLSANAFPLLNLPDTIGKIGKETTTWDQLQAQQQGVTATPAGPTLAPNGPFPNGPPATLGPVPTGTIDPFQQSVNDASRILAPVLTPR